MQPKGQAVDVISFCSAEGEITPLRIRLETEEGERVAGNVEEIIHISDNDWLHVECRCFLCRVRLGERRIVLELKLAMRTHTWTVVRKHC